MFAQQAEEEFESASWPFVPLTTTEHVWDTFVVLALLRDCTAHGVILMVPHDGLQKHCFIAAMQERNERIIYLGQPEITHYCDGCMRVYEEPLTNDQNVSTLRKFTLSIAISLVDLSYPCREMPSRRQ
jgi:hypothetical protein